MCEGYHQAGEEEGFSQLDELLCEYVDGTMDPAVREVFEEYLRANPHVAEHVECLRRTRALLCRYGCRQHAPRGLQARLERQLGCEVLRSQAPYAVMAGRLTQYASLTSAMAVMLLLGMFGGAVLFSSGAMPVAGGSERPREVPRFDKGSAAATIQPRAPRHVHASYAAWAEGALFHGPTYEADPWLPSGDSLHPVMALQRTGAAP